MRSLEEAPFCHAPGERSRARILLLSGSSPLRPFSSALPRNCFPWFLRTTDYVLITSSQYLFRSEHRCARNVTLALLQGLSFCFLGSLRRVRKHCFGTRFCISQKFTSLFFGASASRSNKTFSFSRCAPYNILPFSLGRGKFFFSFFRRFN